MHKNPRVLLFDFGGVLCRLNDPLETFGFDQALPDFMRTWLLSPSVREFECGLVDAETFAQRFVDEARLPLTAVEFLRRFDHWPDRLFPGVPELLNQLSKRYTCAVLSNTNARHWGRRDLGPTLTPLVHTAFLSFETGLLKPDPQAFTHVVNTMACQPEEIVFFDDSLLNVQGANAVGIQSVLIDENSVVQDWAHKNLQFREFTENKKAATD